MISDLLGEKFFEDVASALLQDVTAVLLPGSQLAMVLANHGGRALYKVLKRYGETEQQERMDALSRMPFSRSWDIAARKVAESDLDEDQKAGLVRYLSAIPMTSRQAIHRWNDGGHVTTLLSQLPRDPEEMKRFVPIRPPRFQPGTKVPAHDYRLEALLGQGGFAEVWKARHIELAGQAPVALKFCFDKDLLPSLRREIELLGKLQVTSPGKDFVQLLHTAYSADPPFLVYEFIDGGNLTNWLEGFETEAPKPDDVVSVLKMTARAVAVAHDSGVVHRDLKPSNLLITSQGRVKVADFGIGAVMAETEARKGGGRNEAASQAMSHGAYTPMYADPLRDRVAAPDPRDDVYALGVIAYQLLVGSVTIRMEGAWQRYLESRGVPHGLVRVIENCVAPPEERFRNAGALLAALESPPKKPRRPAGDPKPKAKSVARFCHNCGTRARAGNSFCHNCGYRLPAEPP